MAMTDSIQYRDIDGFPGYRVGDDGSVWSSWTHSGLGSVTTNRWKKLNPGVHRKGYLYVNLRPAGGGRFKTFRIHRLVLAAFIGPCPDGMECRHLNGIRPDCRLANLAWGTRTENIADKLLHANHGRRARLYTHDGRTLVLKEWARIFGIGYACLWHRVTKLSMSFEDAVARPYLGTSSNGGHWTRIKQGKLRSPE